MTQNYTLKLRSESELEDRWRPYEEEVAYIEKIYAERGNLRGGPGHAAPPP